MRVRGEIEPHLADWDFAEGNSMVVSWKFFNWKRVSYTIECWRTLAGEEAVMGIHLHMDKTTPNPDNEITSLNRIRSWYSNSYDSVEEMLSTVNEYVRSMLERRERHEFPHYSKSS